ncbi:MAG: hypothetical protein ACM359_01130 [Bacillota bacterium]
MSGNWRNVLSVGVLVSALAVSAWGKPGDKLEWAIQDTGIAASSSGQTALAMRSGLVWPVIFTESQSGTAYTLVPAGGKTPGSGSWQTMGTGLYQRPASRLRVASSSGSMVIFGGYSSSSGGSVYSTAGGWSSLGSDVTHAAFSRDGNLVTATRNGVVGLPTYSGSTIVDMAVSSAGDVGIIDSSSRYWQYSPWVGRWLSTSFSSLSGVSMRTESLDLEFDSMGRPHVIGSSGNSVYAFDFSTITGTWQVSALAALSGISSTLSPTLIANQKGEVATAWVNAESNGNLMFSYKPDNGDWVTSVVTSGASRMQRQIGLAYDYADNPVISYIGDGGRIMLAYDPVVVPEPGVMGLLAVSGLIALRRNRAA